MLATICWKAGWRLHARPIAAHDQPSAGANSRAACSGCAGSRSGADASARLGSKNGVASMSTPATAIAMRGPMTAAKAPHSAVMPAIAALLVTDHAASVRATRSAGV